MEQSGTIKPAHHPQRVDGIFRFRQRHLFCCISTGFWVVLFLMTLSKLSSLEKELESLKIRVHELESGLKSKELEYDYWKPLLVECIASNNDIAAKLGNRRESSIKNKHFEDYDRIQKKPNSEVNENDIFKHQNSKFLSGSWLPSYISEQQAIKSTNENTYRFQMSSEGHVDRMKISDHVMEEMTRHESIDTKQNMKTDLNLDLTSYLVKLRQKRSMDVAVSIIGNRRNKRRVKTLEKLSANATNQQIIEAVNYLTASRKTSAVHLTANVDPDQLVRAEEGQSLGHYKDGGSFHMRSRIFKIWKKPEWHDKSVFRYYPTSGKVKVKKSGLYLIYLQVTLNDRALRKSIGVHIEDEILPYSECVSFAIRANRIRRSSHLFSSFKNQTAHQDADPIHRIRHQRQMPVYETCNIVTVAPVKAKQKVFVQFLGRVRGVVPKDHLTHWGMIKLD